MAKYWLKTEGIEFEVSKAPQPKIDRGQSTQKVDTQSGLPLWVCEITAWSGENEGATVLVVSVPAREAPAVTWRMPVELIDLEIIPWARMDRGNVQSGVAFKAAEIRRAPVSVSA